MFLLAIVRFYLVLGDKYIGVHLSRKTLGVIGFGHIRGSAQEAILAMGRAVIQGLEVFFMITIFSCKLKNLVK
jgi:hypothetical protein